MDDLLNYARLHPGGTALVVGVVLAGLYLLLNRKPKVVREAEQRERQLKDQNRERYRHGRSV